MSADLRRLADALGIAADYEDVWGRRHETGDPVRRALLGAMGIAADSDALIHDALVALEHDRWLQPMPPLTVVRDSAPLQLTVRTAANESRRFELRVATEDGAQLALTPDTATSLASADSTATASTSCVCSSAHRRRSAITARSSGRRSHHRRARARGRSRHLLSAGIGARWAPVWGLALQLYGCARPQLGHRRLQRSGAVVRICGRSGAGIIGVNPLHALFPHNPRHAVRTARRAGCF